MTIRLLVLACLTLSACTPTAREVEATDNKPSPSGITGRKTDTRPAPGSHLASPQLEPSIIPKVSEPFLAPRYHTLTWRDVTISALSFDDREFQLKVADQPDGCGSRWLNAQSAAEAYLGLAAINGGFFTPEGKPLGLLVEDGIKRGHLNHSSLGAGFFISSPAGSALIRRGSSSSTDPTLHANHLLQSGPLLVEAGTVVSGLSEDKMRRRSFLAWNGKHHWIMGHAGPTTLHALAKALLDLPIDDFHIDTALNLDGGTSSDLWVGAKVPNGNKSHRSVFNKPVRNYLVLTAR